MKAGIIGSRNFKDYDLMCKILDPMGINCVVSGGAVGADSLAELWANSHSIELIVFKPDWSIGRSAAAIRNIKIVENSDIIIAFWDGISKGTKMTIGMAEKNKKQVLIIKI